MKICLFVVEEKINPPLIWRFLDHLTCKIPFKIIRFRTTNIYLNTIVSHDHAANATTDFFDMDFHRLDMRMKDPNSDIIPSRPVLFDSLKAIAEKLSGGIPFVRVDMYVINGQIYFGELTFFHNAGFTKVHPEQWEKTLGDWIDISQV